MATKKPAKIASKKKGGAVAKSCPVCASPMVISKILRSEGPSGMFWLCSSNTCSTILSTAGANLGKLQMA
jgi:ssDNA-binding Zn-finger/Zn-ribbon topoisomerase 1